MTGDDKTKWKRKPKHTFAKFLYKNNFWFWSILSILVFAIIYVVCRFAFDYKFVKSEVADTFISGQFAIIGFILTVAAFVFTSKAGIVLMKNKPHGATFFKVLVFTVLYSLISILSYTFSKEPLPVYIFTVASLVNIIVAFYYLYFTLKNFAENPDSTP